MKTLARSPPEMSKIINNYNRILEIAEHVMRKVETDLFIAHHSNIDDSFAIMSKVCDDYSGILDDDTLTWEFIYGSCIKWNKEADFPTLWERRREERIYIEM